MCVRGGGKLKYSIFKFWLNTAGKFTEYTFVPRNNSLSEPRDLCCKTIRNLKKNQIKSNTKYCRLILFTNDFLTPAPIIAHQTEYPVAGPLTYLSSCRAARSRRKRDRVTTMITGRGRAEQRRNDGSGCDERDGTTGRVASTCEPPGGVKARV